MMQLDFKQQQKGRLVMTPELRQAVQLLQFSAGELLDHVRREAGENPLLELEEAPDAVYAGSKPSAGSHSASSFSGDWLAAGPGGIYEGLEAQLGLIRGLPERERRIASYLAGNLDERGYLQIEPGEAAGLLGVGPEEVEDALCLIQSLEPAGVGARSLGECLRLQLERAGSSDQLVLDIVCGHLEDLAANRLPRLAEKLRVPLAEIRRASELIRSLHPAPGLIYGSSRELGIIPDLIAEPEGPEGGFRVRLNGQTEPRVSLHPTYRAMIDDAAQPEDTRNYLQGRYAAASLLLRQLEQRRATLLRVAGRIVKCQSECLAHGLQALRPLSQKELATELGVHESTISRTVNGKYLRTPLGVFELKQFFSVPLPSGGEAVSGESIRAAIGRMIGEENKRQPLSDQRIADLLGLQGVQIARRTVAKYREELGCPAAAIRKRH
ncbi:RNA polymerase sigma-54 factor 1 [compost metagenome]